MMMIMVVMIMMMMVVVMLVMMMMLMLLHMMGDDSNHTSAEWYTRVSHVITCPNASCGWICSYVTNTPPAPPFTNPAAHRTIASPSPG